MHQALTHADDLKPFEPAARLYCKKVQMDPDENLPAGERNGTAVFRPRWMIPAEQMLHMQLMLICLRDSGRSQIILPH